MVYYLYLLLLSPIYSLISIFFLRDKDREILILRQQLLIMWRDQHPRGTLGAQHARRMPRPDHCAERKAPSLCAEGIRGVFYETPSSPRPETANSRQPGGAPATGCIRSRQVLGGLINDYYREAA
jgi:hypothetical protein